jgi:hypothetical protein
LQPDPIFADVYSFYFEINADGGEMRHHEVIFAKTQEYIGLSYAAIADN